MWVGYYYDGRGEDGKRKEIPLGTDLDLAKLEWARLDASPAPKTLRKWGDVFDRYEKEIIPGKAPRTQKDNLLSLTQLRKAFSEAPVEALTPPSAGTVPGQAVREGSGEQGAIPLLPHLQHRQGVGNRHG
ncbi:site-specific recombinase, phage integrase family [Pseudomonas aeruginosa]|nr:site-specific recombinase, phage integrase family [Pseudomonas aeruginosa]